MTKNLKIGILMPRIAEVMSFLHRTQIFSTNRYKNKHQHMVINQEIEIVEI